MQPKFGNGIAKFTERQHLRTGVSGLLDSTRHFTNRISEYAWEEPDGLDVHRQLILRAILIKQFEYLDELYALVNPHRGHIAVPLLRPMCEELIWLQYSLSISEEKSQSLFFHLGSIGIYETFLAQEKYAKEKKMGDLGFPLGTEERLSIAAERSKSELEKLGKELGWRTRQGQVLPTVKSIARSVGMLAMYELLYHATSRTVHFSVPELLRRIWGKPGRMSVTSNNYERYWADFALYWGGWIFSQTFSLTAPELTHSDDEADVFDPTDFAKSAMLLLSKGGIPILTVEEIAWPFDSGASHDN
jgi:hypothetical protein